jgi:hypothetical protein
VLHVHGTGSYRFVKGLLITRYTKSVTLVIKAKNRTSAMISPYDILLLFVVNRIGGVTPSRNDYHYRSPTPILTKA